jgi:hypothetical protein
MGLSGQCHAPAALYPRERTRRYPLNRRLGGPQCRSGHRLQERSFASGGDRTPAVQSVVRYSTILPELPQTVMGLYKSGNLQDYLRTINFWRKTLRCRTFSWFAFIAWCAQIWSIQGWLCLYVHQLSRLPSMFRLENCGTDFDNTWHVLHAITGYPKLALLIFCM